MMNARRGISKPEPEHFRASFAEFFAGVGLVRAALEPLGFEVAFANDIEQKKHRLYETHFGPSPEFKLSDIRRIRGRDVPQVDVATASFPCTDLSLAGNRKGLAGEQSGAFHEFARVISEMGRRRPPVVMLENVLGFATSHGGEDLRAVLLRLNDLGYGCDLFMLDARWFVAQSRPRLFVVGRKMLRRVPWAVPSASPIRPAWLLKFMLRNRDVAFAPLDFPSPAPTDARLADAVERVHPRDPRWWPSARKAAFRGSLLPIHAERLAEMMRSPRRVWATAYRRTRNGRATWEIRADDLAGCLRTTRGGSSRQAVVEAGRGLFRVRWMTAREYAILQGAGSFRFDPSRENEAMFAFGDAVCVPVVAWIGEHCLRPAVEAARKTDRVQGGRSR